MTKHGKSRDSIQRAVTIVVSLNIVILLSNPALDIAGIGGLIADIIDPYDYQNTWTRKALDKFSRQNVQDIQASIQSPEIKKQLADAARAATPILTDAEINDIVDKQLAYYQRKVFVPENYTECFFDFQSSDDVSLSGPPGAGCDAFYKKEYENYILNNKERYIQEQIQDGNDLIRARNIIREVVFRDQLKAESQWYIIAFLSVLVAVVVAIVVIVVLHYVWKR
jgi:hypothetical protein